MTVHLEDLKGQIDASVEQFRKYNAVALNKIEEKLTQGAMKIEADAKRLFKGRDDDSVKGEPPRVDTGRLRGSITHRGTRDDAGNYGQEIGTNVEYAYGLETGTSRTWPHPFMVPALEMNRDAIYEALGRALKEAENA